MTKIPRHFPNDTIGGIFPEKLVHKLTEHHPYIRDSFNVQFSSLKEYFYDKVSYLINTKKYILDQITNKYSQLRSYEDIIIDDIEFTEIKKVDLEKNIEKSLNFNHLILYGDVNITVLKGKIKFKSPLYLDIEKELDFIIYINKNNFDFLNNNKKDNFSFEIHYGLENTHNPSGPEIDIFFNENEKLGKISKQEMFKKIDNKIKKYFEELNLGELLISDFKTIENKFYNLPKLSEFNSELESLVEEINNGEINEKYLYFGKGASKYNEVVNSRQYGLGNTELELLKSNSSSLEENLGKNIIDIGSGNGKKAKVIFDNINSKHNYIAIDSSIGMLLEGSKNINKEGIKRENLNIDFNSLYKLKNISNKTLLFLGSTLGNFDNDKQIEVLSGLFATLGNEDNIILGIDFEKENIKELINSYYSKQSEEFIFSIFNQLGIKSEDLELKVQYHPLIKTIESGVILKKNIEIETKYGKIKKKKGDYIKCINSKKFNTNNIKNILSESGLEIQKEILDTENQYGLYVVKKIQNKLQKSA